MTGCFPDKVRLAKDASMFKNHDKHIVNSNGPISVLSVLSKILEQNRLLYFLNNNDISIKNLFGLRENT